MISPRDQHLARIVPSCTPARHPRSFATTRRHTLACSAMRLSTWRMAARRALASLLVLASSASVANGCGGSGTVAGNPSKVPSASGETSQGGPQPPAEPIVEVEDDGKSFDVAVGSSVTFKLANHAGAGYVWMPTGVDSSVLAQEGERRGEDVGKPSSEGAAAKSEARERVDEYRFVAEQRGWVPVQMDLQRPWTKGAMPVKSIRVIVNVR